MTILLTMHGVNHHATGVEVSSPDLGIERDFR